MSRAEPDYIDKNFLVGLLEDLLQANNYVPEEDECEYSDEDHAYYRGKQAAYGCILDLLREGK